MRFLTFIFLIIGFFTNVWAQGGNSAKASSAAPVHIGVYANQLTGMSLKDGYFDIDYYLWFRWQDKRLKPHKTTELTNGKQNCITVAEEIKAGFHYVTLRCSARVNKQWELADYPLDNQVLELKFEDGALDEESLQFVADAASSTFSPEFKVPGWEIAGKSDTVLPHLYKSNFGDPTLSPDAETRYSRYVYSLNLDRGSYAFGVAFKLFFPLVIAIFIALLQFFVPIDSTLRFNLAVGSIFASVGAGYAISNSLPFSVALTKAESINLLTILAIFAALVGLATSIRIFKRTNDVLASKRFDRKYCYFLAASYGIGIAVVLWP